MVYAVVVFVWLGILTYLVWQQKSFLQALFPRAGERDIRRKFEEILKTVEDFKLDLKKTTMEMEEAKKRELSHISRVRLLRYNPYEDTGGDQSFTVALLDAKGSGIILTSLHARSQTRVFAKPVSEGKGSTYRFSKEEEHVVKKAMNNG